MGAQPIDRNKLYKIESGFKDISTAMGVFIESEYQR